jgi:hypothetical protein
MGVCDGFEEYAPGCGGVKVADVGGPLAVEVADHDGRGMSGGSQGIV